MSVDLIENFLLGIVTFAVGVFLLRRRKRFVRTYVQAGDTFWGRRTWLWAPLTVRIVFTFGGMLALVVGAAFVLTGFLDLLGL